MATPRSHLNYSAQTVASLLFGGAAAATIVGLYTSPTNALIAFAWVFLALVGLFYSCVAIKQGRDDLDLLAQVGVTPASRGSDLATLVFKRAHVRSMVLYAFAHGMLLQVGVVGIVVQMRFQRAQLSKWFAVYSAASLIFALYTLSLNLVLDSTVHRRMREAANEPS